MTDHAVVWAEERTGTDGKRYSVRYLLTRTELAAMQAVGLIGEVSEVVGLDEVVFVALCQYDKAVAMSSGMVLQ